MTIMLDKPLPHWQTKPDDPEITCAYVPGMLHQQTYDAVRRTGIPYSFIPVDQGDPHAYARLFRRQWTGARDLLWIEQDMLPPFGAFADMLGCDSPWCSFLYHCDNDTPTWGLGLCKFSMHMQQHVPTLGAQASRDHLGNVDRQHWATLNERIILLADHFGYRVHLHELKAGHLHDYEATRAAHP